MVAGERTLELAGVRVPEDDILVLASSRDLLSIRAEDDTTHLIGMRVEDMQTLAGVDVPETGSQIVGGAVEPLAIRREVQACAVGDSASVAIQGAQALTSLGGPEGDSLVRASTGQAFTIWANGEGPDLGRRLPLVELFAVWH